MYRYFTAGLVPVNLTIPGSLEYIDRLHPELEAGGKWRPTHCQARHRVAIVIPYRNRLPNLKLFLQHMHPFLQKQLLDYQIIVAEQVGMMPF